MSYITNENKFLSISFWYRECSVTLTTKDNFSAVSFFQFKKGSFSNKDRSLLLLCKELSQPFAVFPRIIEYFIGAKVLDVTIDDLNMDALVDLRLDEVLQDFTQSVQEPLNIAGSCLKIEKSFLEEYGVSTCVLNIFFLIMMQLE